MSLSLVKGQKISLSKGGETLKSVCVGVNWGAVESTGFFGNVKKTSVDLDASVGMFDSAGRLVDRVWYGQLASNCSSIQHSGDDLTGDMDGDDGLDNEVIVCDLARVPAGVEKVVFVLNSYSKQDFKEIPFAKIRIYEGAPERVNNVIATYDIANDASFAGSISMVMGRLYRHSGTWKFAAIGEPTRDADLQQTLNTVAASYL